MRGLGVLTGIDVVDVPGASAGFDNDYAGQAKGAIDALERHDLVVVHVETPDEAGHAGDAVGKVAGIEAEYAKIGGTALTAASATELAPARLRARSAAPHASPIRC